MNGGHHVGRRWFPAGAPLQEARARAVLSSAVLGAVAAEGREYSYAVYPRMLAPEKERTVITTLNVAQWGKRLRETQPWPFSFREAFTPDRI